MSPECLRSNFDRECSSLRSARLSRAEFARLRLAGVQRAFAAPAVTPNCGRDHHVNGFTLCLAGGGFKGGSAYGETDDFGNAVVAQPMSVHDIHATILHQLGIDHTKLTYSHGGRDIRLTDTHGEFQ